MVTNKTSPNYSTRHRYCRISPLSFAGICAALVFTLLFCTGGLAYAQPGSKKPITIVVPFSPGSGSDILARTLTDPLRERLGQIVVVENRVGASGNIGTGNVARAAPDGNTLLLTANTIVLNAGLFKDPGYDPITSFSPIMEIATGHMALVTNPALPPNTVQEFIAFAKARPADSIHYATPGRGTPHHLAMELFKSSTGMQLEHVPYSGLAKSITDVVGGHVETMFVGLHSVTSLVRNSKLKVLGVGSRERLASAPEVPTIAEQGLPGFEVEAWFGLLAPAATPLATINRINAAMNDALKQPEVTDVLAKQGLDLIAGSPERLRQLLAADLEKWLKVIKDAGIPAE
jgi:tripartite-type tricarboxylate transporter receptor subunit TctC